jgi:acyl-CoA thioester hydrolase
MTESKNQTNSGPLIVETRLRVRYAETDQMGVVYHANYFVWFEVGRVEYLRAKGFSYRDMEEKDRRRIAVVEARCRYKSPARYDDQVIIRTSVARQRGPILHFAYEAVRESDGEVLALGETVHLVLDDNFEPAELPEKYRSGLKPSSQERSN